MERVPAFSADTIMGELRNWNRLEKSIMDLSSSDKDLNTRKFQRFKLTEYERLWHKYNGNARTIDDRAYLVIVDHHRRAIEKALYPGLLRRALHRLGNALEQALFNRTHKKNNAFPDTYIPVPSFSNNRPDQQHAQQTGLEQTQAPRKRYGQDLGRRLRRNPGKSKGHSL